MKQENEFILGIKKELFSGNEDAVLQCIDSLRTSGNSDVIPILLDLYIVTSKPVIKNNILSLLSDIKTESAIIEFTNAIQNNKYKTIKKELISICWHNGLDFSHHIDTFIEVFINDEFLIAFEAFTVIDEMRPKLNKLQIDNLLDRLHKSELTVEKKELSNYLINNFI